MHLLDPICKSESSNVERPAYCKDKIYCGTQEFSFEEIRALRVMERRRQKKLQGNFACFAEKVSTVAPRVTNLILSMT